MTALLGMADNNSNMEIKQEDSLFHQVLGFCLWPWFSIISCPFQKIHLKAERCVTQSTIVLIYHSSEPKFYRRKSHTSSYDSGKF